MKGGALKAQLAELMQRHRVKPLARAALPLLPATSTSQVVSGLAASSDIDGERCSFQRGSLSWPDLATVPLLISHDKARIAGRIVSLTYDADGRLHIKALVEDPFARQLPAFSIAASVFESEIINGDSAVGYHGLIKRAVIDEISLTDR